MNTTMRIAMTAVMAGAAAAASGCLVSGHSNSTTSGAFVGQTTFNQIEPGHTTEKWVRAVLGEPTTCTELEDGSQLLKWSYRQKHSSSGSVLFVFGGSNKRDEVGATFVQVQDGVVTKAWRD